MAVRHRRINNCPKSTSRRSEEPVLATLEFDFSRLKSIRRGMVSKPDITKKPKCAEPATCVKVTKVEIHLGQYSSPV